MKKIFFTCAFLTFSGCNRNGHEAVIFDVRAIVNKTPAETEAEVGKPDSTYTLRIMGKPIFCQLYEKHQVEIQYPEMKATDIVVNGPHGLPFNQSALRAFNIDYKTHHPKQYVKDRLIRWLNVEEFSAISFYNPQFDSSGNISNFTIFFKAKPMQ
jgi:hypothetical protein